MILLVCAKCGEGVTLTRRARRACPCGAAYGYMREERMFISADTLPIGLPNNSVMRGFENPPLEGEWGRFLEAMLMPLNRFTVEGEDGPDENLSAEPDGDGEQPRGILPRLSSAEQPE